MTDQEREALRRKLLEVVLRHGRVKSQAMRMDMAAVCAEFMRLSAEDAEVLRGMLSLEHKEETSRPTLRVVELRTDEDP